MKYSILVLTLILSSCALKKEVVKVEGVKKVSFVGKTDKPQLYFDNEAHYKASRSISSVVDLNMRASKNLYFLSLYSQYKTLAKVMKKVSVINSCPQFHQQVLHNKVKSSQVTMYDEIDFHKVRSNPKLVTSYTALALSYKNQNLLSYFNKQNWKKTKYHVKKALESRHNQMKHELKNLCETGESDGFYAYQNFRSISQENRNYKSLSAFLKLPVFANMAILNNFKYIPSAFEKTLLKDSDIAWFQKYLDDRKNTVKDSKYVKVVSKI